NLVHGEGPQRLGRGVSALGHDHEQLGGSFVVGGFHHSDLIEPSHGEPAPDRLASPRPDALIALPNAIRKRARLGPALIGPLAEADVDRHVLPPSGWWPVLCHEA